MREKILNSLFLHGLNEAKDPVYQTRLTILSWGYLSTALCYIQCVLMVGLIGDLQENTSIAYLPFLFLDLFFYYLLIRREWLISLTHVKIWLLALPILANSVIMQDEVLWVLDIAAFFNLLIFSIIILPNKWTIFYFILSAVPISLGYFYYENSYYSDLFYGYDGGEYVFISVLAYLFIIASISLLLIKNALTLSMTKMSLQSQKLKQANQELTDQKTAEAKAREHAELANKAKSTFLATMSHEIRTPLNGVLGMAGLLKETPLNKEQKEFTDIIGSSGETLMNVINDILDYSRLESGDLEIDPYHFQLRNIIEEVLDLFSGQAAKKGLDLLYHLPDEIPSHIQADGLRIKQILMNLVSNALKFTNQGEVLVEVKVIAHQGEKWELCFRVRDSGIGIPEDKLSRLFKSFSQVDASTTRKYGGTGLGLAICQRLVKLMGGSIGVESKEGEGSTFYFNLEVEASSAEKPALLPNPDQKGLVGKNVLIVDDNATNLKILGLQLENLSMKPYSVLDPEQAMEVLEINREIDLIITDMDMPHTNGMQLSKKIKAKYPDKNIILLSSVGDQSRKKNRQLFTDVLSKPVKYKKLISAIHTALIPNTVKREEKVITEKVLHKEFAALYPLRILVAEDTPINQKLIMMLLSRLGYEPDLVSNGKEVLEKARNCHYDLILMDVQMPEMDGLEATERVRKEITDEGLQIFAMTAGAMKEDMQRCMNAGMDGYISKPLGTKKLMDLLRTASENSNATALG
jgi:signal transduction histidine kinase/DNA-binding response OmpR family regulator